MVQRLAVSAEFLGLDILLVSTTPNKKKLKNSISSAHVIRILIDTYLIWVAGRRERVVGLV